MFIRSSNVKQPQIQFLPQKKEGRQDGARNGSPLLLLFLFSAGALLLARAVELEGSRQEKGEKRNPFEFSSPYLTFTSLSPFSCEFIPWGAFVSFRSSFFSPPFPKIPPPPPVGRKQGKGGGRRVQRGRKKSLN